METLSKELEALTDGKEINALFEDINLPEGMNLEDLKAFIGILSIPDDQFKLIMPMMLQEMQVEVRKPDYIYDTLKDIKKAGGTIEDFAVQRDALIESIKGIEEISQIKIDFLHALFDETINALYEIEGKNQPISIPIQLINDNAKIPVYAHETDAGLDVYALEDITIAPGETKLIPLGFKLAIPNGYEIQVRPKSGRCLKTKLRIANTPGTIDAGYRDEVGVIIDNIDPFIKNAKLDASGNLTEIEFGSSYTIGKGEKFAQLVLAKLAQANFHEVEDVSIFGIDREGGFGSTGLK